MKVCRILSDYHRREDHLLEKAYGDMQQVMEAYASLKLAEQRAKMPMITDEEIEKQFTTPHYHYEKGHYYKVCKDRIFGAKWMRDWFRNRMEGIK